MELFDENLMALDGMRKALAVLAVCAVADALLVTGEALALAWVLAGLWALAGAAAFSLAEYAPCIVAFAGCYLCRQLVRTVRSGFMERRAQWATDGLVRSVSQALLEAGPRLVQQLGAGSTTAVLNEGAERVQAYIELALPKAVDMMVVPAVLAVALLVLDWISGVIAILAVPCIVFYMRMLGRGARQAARAQHDEYERLTNHFGDTLRGFPTLKLFGRSARYGAAVHERSEALRSATVKTLRTVTLSSLVLDLFCTFTLAAIAVMLGFRLMDGSCGLFPALAVLVVVPELFAAIRRFSADHHATLAGKNQLAAIVRLLQTAERLRLDNVVPASKDEPPAQGVLAPRVQKVVSAQGPVAAVVPHAAVALELRGVCYSHGHGDERRTALHDVSFAVCGPRKVGIVGASGAGKSTLAMLLAGFAEPDGAEKRIVLDGMAHGSLAARAWRSQVAYIPQEPHIFRASLRDNMAFYAPAAAHEDIEQAVAAVGLESLAAQLPDGLETLVGQGARQLSGGQAQRVALARALLDTNRRVWVLDEPTAHLDIETELELKERMLALMEGRLVFFATHRLHWMRDMDDLLVLEHGRVVQQGSYEQLVASGGTFAQLVDALRYGYASGAGGGEHGGTATRTDAGRCGRRDGSGPRDNMRPHEPGESELRSGANA